MLSEDAQRVKASVRTKLEDTTTVQSDLTELTRMLLHELARVQSPALAPHASAQEREAARWFYEQAQTYRSMLFKRPLLRSVEYISGGPPGGAFHQQPGWYYKAPPGPNGHSPTPNCAFNWYGPHASHAEALAARDKNHPKSKTALLLAQFDADPANFD